MALAQEVLDPPERPVVVVAFDNQVPPARLALRYVRHELPWVEDQFDHMRGPDEVESQVATIVVDIGGGAFHRHAVAGSRLAHSGDARRVDVGTECLKAELRGCNHACAVAEPDIEVPEARGRLATQFGV